MYNDQILSVEDTSPRSQREQSCQSFLYPNFLNIYHGPKYWVLSGVQDFVNKPTADGDVFHLKLVQDIAVCYAKKRNKIYTTII